MFKAINLIALFAVTLFVSACGSSSSSPNTIDPQGAREASGFESSDDGWTIVGDAQASSVKPDYNGTGGNPDGLISAVDDVTGGVWFFKAPSRYLGDASATYGHYLKYDLKTTNVSNPFNDFDVVLEGNGKIVVFVFTTPINPGTNTWTSYKVQLNETAGWKIVESYAYGNFEAIEATYNSVPAPSKTEFQSVLANLTSFMIRGEFNTGSDTGYLDNVRFGATQ
jgi:hypothetical protein